MIKFLILFSVFATPVFGDALPIVTVTEEQGATQYSLTLQLLALMTLLSVLPAMLLGLTSFVRIIIVLSLLRQALGTMQTPPNTVLVGIALFLTFFVMAPVFNSVYDTAILPFLNEEISIEAAIAAVEVPCPWIYVEPNATGGYWHVCRDRRDGGDTGREECHFHNLGTSIYNLS